MTPRDLEVCAHIDAALDEYRAEQAAIAHTVFGPAPAKPPADPVARLEVARPSPTPWFGFIPRVNLRRNRGEGL